MRFEVYRDRGKKWRWRMVSRNGRKVAASGESFHSKGNAKRAAKRFLLWWGPGAPVPIEVIE